MASRAVLLMLMASAGLLAQPADARPRERRDEPARQERQEARRERRERHEHRERQSPDNVRDERGSRGHSADRPSAAAMRAVERNGGGRVLSVEPAGAGYRVKVLKDGEVRTHQVDD